MTAAATTTEEEGVAMAGRKKTMNVVYSSQHHNRPSSVISTSPLAECHHQHRTRQMQCNRECQRTDFTRNDSRRMGVGGQSNNASCILTPKMLNASNSRSLRDLLHNETNKSNTTSSSRTAYHRTTLNTGNSTTYFTTGTGRILPTNTWTMHQAQQHYQLLPDNNCAAHPHQKQQQQQQHNKSNPNPELIHHQNKSIPPRVISASNPTETRRDHALMMASLAASPAALVDESLGHQPKTTSSTSRQQRRRLTFPTNDTPPDLPFVPRMNPSENVVSGHHYQGGRRRHTVTSIANVKQS